MTQYMLLIQHGDMPKPGSPEWQGLSADEQKAIYAGYKAIDETPGVTPGQWLENPEHASWSRAAPPRERMAFRKATLTKSSKTLFMSKTNVVDMIAPLRSLTEATARISSARANAGEYRWFSRGPRHSAAWPTRNLITFEGFGRPFSVPDVLLGGLFRVQRSGWPYRSRLPAKLRR
jgi:hypothetical protein